MKLVTYVCGPTLYFGSDGDTTFLNYCPMGAEAVGLIRAVHDTNSTRSRPGKVRLLIQLFEHKFGGKWSVVVAHER